MEGLLLIRITYKNAARKIIGSFAPPMGWTLGDLKRDIERTNAAYGGGIRAYMTVAKEASTPAPERASA